MISTGRSRRCPNTGARCRTSNPAASGRLVVAASIPTLASMFNRTVLAFARAHNAPWAANGVSSAEIRGYAAVNPAASARSARAMRAKTGTTGANGAAPRRIIATATCCCNPKHVAAPTLRAGITMKLATRMATNRHCFTAVLTSFHVSRNPTAPSSPARALQVRIWIMACVRLTMGQRLILLRRVPQARNIRMPPSKWLLDEQPGRVNRSNSRTRG